MADSSIGAHPGILAINGGRPFAWIERFRLTGRRGGTLLYVYGALHALARYQAESEHAERGMESIAFETPRGGWGRFLGLSERNAQRYVRKLKRMDLIQRSDFGLFGERACWFLHENALALRDEGRLGLRLELGPMAAPGWSDGMRAVWIALCVRADSKTLQCFPGLATIAADAGLDRRSAQRALRRIERDGFLRVEQRRRSSLYTLLPSEGYATSAAPRMPPAPPQGMTPAPPPYDTSAAPPMTPAPPKLEPVIGTYGLEQENRNLLTAHAPRHEGAIDTFDQVFGDIFDTGGRTIEGTAAVVNEDDPEVQRRRRQAADIVARARGVS